MSLPQEVVLGGIFQAYLLPGVVRVIKGNNEFMDSIPGGLHDALAGTPTGGTVKMPYVVMQDGIESSDDCLTTVARTVFVTFEIYSNYQGRKESVQIADKLVMALNRRERLIDANPWKVTSSMMDTVDVVPDQDNRFTCFVRFRFSGQPLR